MPVPGYDTFVLDDPIAGGAATDTAVLYLLSPTGPAAPTVKTAPRHRGRHA